MLASHDLSGNAVPSVSDGDKLGSALDELRVFRELHPVVRVAQDGDEQTQHDDIGHDEITVKQQRSTDAQNVARRPERLNNDTTLDSRSTLVDLPRNRIPPGLRRTTFRRIAVAC